MHLRYARLAFWTPPPSPPHTHSDIKPWKIPVSVVVRSPAPSFPCSSCSFHGNSLSLPPSPTGNCCRREGAAWGMGRLNPQASRSGLCRTSVPLKIHPWMGALQKDHQFACEGLPMDPVRNHTRRLSTSDISCRFFFAHLCIHLFNKYGSTVLGAGGMRKNKKQTNTGKGTLFGLRAELPATFVPSNKTFFRFI